MAFKKPAPGAVERRSIVGEIRSLTNFEISGLAAAYNSKSKNLGGFREQIRPGAFARSIREAADVKALVNHDPNRLLGRVKNNTLALRDTPAGLAFTVKLNPESQAHRDLYACVQRGDMDECSFAFLVPSGGESWDDDDEKDERGNPMKLRTLTDLNLMDVSCVTYPAYEETSCGARSADYCSAGYVPRTVPPVLTKPWGNDPVKWLQSPQADELRRKALEGVGKLVEADKAQATREHNELLADVARYISDLQLELRMATQAGNWTAVYRLEKLLEKVGQ